jgi:peroxiredoxin Q/BCP
MLKIGDSAPSFRVAAHDCTTVSLDELHGKKVLLWFYPKADTPG